ncbi:MAG: carbohydrate porin [Phycisphaeraceae bacterium]|nr:carbohydrate porin [Phycisphaeraceae bacterium]
MPTARRTLKSAPVALTSSTATKRIAIRAIGLTAAALCVLALTAPTWAQAEPTEPTQPAEPAPESVKESVYPYTPYEPWTGGEAPTSTPIELEDIYVPRRGVLDMPALDRPFDQIVDWSRSLEVAIGLRLGFAYTMVFQQATGGPGDRAGSAGDLDLFGTWTLLGRGTKNTGQLVFSGEYRHKIGPISAFDLRNEVGSLQRTTNGFNDRGWVVRDLYWVQRLFEDRLRLGIGRADPSDFFGSHWMQNLNASFFNRAFSANSVVPSPGHGTTGGFSIRPTDEFFITAGLSNMYGRSTINDWDTLDEGDFFTFVEFGFTPTIKDLGRGRYRLLIWHADARVDNGNPSDRGFSIVADQELGEVLQIFARYGFADEGTLTGIRSSFEIGLGFRGLLGAPNNLTGAAFAYSTAPSGGGQDEKILETFHRWQLTGFTQFSIGAQAIIDPSNNPDDDVVGVFSARFRIAF